MNLFEAAERALAAARCEVQVCERAFDQLTATLDETYERSEELRALARRLWHEMNKACKFIRYGA